MSSFSRDDVLVIKLLLNKGFPSHRIASLFDCNQGRIAEIRNEQKHRDVSWPDLSEGKNVRKGERLSRK